MDRGLARAETSKRKQRKWVRYERAQSMSAGHIDWYEDATSGLKICAGPGSVTIFAETTNSHKPHGHKYSSSRSPKYT